MKLEKGLHRHKLNSLMQKISQKTGETGRKLRLKGSKRCSTGLRLGWRSPEKRRRLTKCFRPQISGWVENPEKYQECTFQQ